MSLAQGLSESDLWNMKSATGYVKQCYGASGLSTNISLDQITLAKPFDFVVGYPEVAFGHNYAGQEFAHSDSAAIQFPLQLETLDSRDFWANMTYSISIARPAQMDLAYDLWIKNSTQGAPTSGDFEVMIDPVDTYLYASSYDTTVMQNETIIINGQRQTSSWNVYSFPYGGTDAKLIVFAMASPAQSLKEAISLKPNDFISFLRTSMGLNIPRSYWLMGIELGSEFYPQPFGAQPTWSWNISKFSISVASSHIWIIP